MNDISIRQADLSDLETIRHLSVQTFIETFSDVNSQEDMDKYISDNLNLPTLEAELKDHSSIFYLAEYEKNATAFMKVNFEDAQTEKGHHQSLEIQRIYALAQYKGMGIGKMLMQQAFELARTHQLSYIWLGVWEKNIPAIQFYEKQGFVRFGEHIFKLGDDEQIDYLLRLDL